MRSFGLVGLRISCLFFSAEKVSETYRTWSIFIIENDSFSRAMSGLLTKQLLFEGYARLVVGFDDILIPLCIIELLIEFFTSKHCLMLYSVNRKERLGKIQLIDSTFCKNITKTIQDPIHITDNMSNMNKSIAFASNVRYSFYDKHHGYDSVFTISDKTFTALLFNAFDGEFVTKLSIVNTTDWWFQCSLLYSHKLQTIISTYSWTSLVLNVDTKLDLRWNKIDHELRSGFGCFVDDDETKLFIHNHDWDRFVHLNRFGISDNTTKLKTLASNRRRHHSGMCSSENDNRVYLVGGEGGDIGHYADYYDLLSNKWVVLPNSKYHHYEPLLWTDSSTMLYVLRKEVGAGEIGIIEGFDSRCNKWIDLEKDRQLREAITIPKSISMYSGQYVAHKLLTVSL